jgi:hypothetical protein
MKVLRTRAAGMLAVNTLPGISSRISQSGRAYHPIFATDEGRGISSLSRPSKGSYASDAILMSLPTGMLAVVLSAANVPAVWVGLVLIGLLAGIVLTTVSLFRLRWHDSEDLRVISDRMVEQSTQPFRDWAYLVYGITTSAEQAAKLGSFISVGLSNHGSAEPFTDEVTGKRYRIILHSESVDMYEVGLYGALIALQAKNSTSLTQEDADNPQIASVPGSSSTASTTVGRV